MKKTLFLILSLFSVGTLAKTCEQADNEIHHSLREIYRFGTFGENSDEYQRELATKKLVSTLKNYLSQTDSLSCDFSKSTQNDELLIISSADKKIRAFSWDNQSGGTMRDHDVIIQSVNKLGKLTLDERDGIDYIKDIFTTKLNDQPYYWLINYSIVESQNHGISAELYTINEQGLILVKLIKTKKLTGVLGFTYSPLSEDPALPDGEPARYFRYDDQTKTLSFPVVIETNDYPYGKITDKRIQYRFDGQYFVRIKN